MTAGHHLPSMAEEIGRSLAGRIRFIHPKFFYDEAGSLLFEQITTLPEYYPTRSEMEILRSMRPGLAGFLQGDFALVELGSGSAKKTRLLLDLLAQRQETVEYYPIDISSIIKESSLRLQRDYKNIKITGILGQYENGLSFVKGIACRKVIAFLGSSIGNFSPAAASRLLKNIRLAMGPSDLLLLGLDLAKQRDVLESAYNDFAGITAKFNLNVLKRINAELGGNFDLQNFEHLAFYNQSRRRIEMHLRSRQPQEITISSINLSFKLRRGETILTEHSYKFTHGQIESMARGAGLGVKGIWHDSRKFFAVALLSP